MLSITGIEVIRAETGAIAVLPGAKIELGYGDTLRITASFKYRGPAQDITLYGAIGARKPIVGFDEIIAAEAPPVWLPHSPTEFSPEVTASVDIPITADIGPGTGYDIYVKIKEYPGAGMPEVDDVITITGVPPTFELLEETVYPYAYVYEGKCEIATFTFKTDPFTPAGWIAGWLADRVEAEVEKAGGRIMEMRVYIDRGPLLWSDWRIEVVTTPAPATAGLGTPLGIWWLGPAIIAALAIIFIIVATLAIKTISSAFTHKALSEEIKKTWSRETLVKVIGDFEAKLERTPTPPEELEKKSDQGLRDYCDELAEAISPAGPSWVLWAAVGAGVVGAGALAVALSQRKPAKT